MPAPTTPQRHRLVHQLLRQAHTLLAAADDEEAPSLAALLAHAAGDLRAEDGADLDPPGIAWLAAEAAGQLLAGTRTPIQPQDPHLASYLQALDRLPRTARAGLLAAAVRRTAFDLTTLPTPGVPANGEGLDSRRRAAGACPCPCSNGGFCGGCGHAGCGGRR